MSENTIVFAAEKIRMLRTEIEKEFIGQYELVSNALITLVAGGHLLIEGAPGLGKTLLVRCIARAIGGQSTRIQFTPDLMPSDITGNIMLDTAQGKFITKQGPVFTNLLIADEINRAPAKTQAALFEAMQEYQVSLDGTSYALPRPFMTLATENPFEHEGTYPLPEAQKDRFLMKVLAPYPSFADETVMVKQIIGYAEEAAPLSASRVNTVTSPEEILKIQGLCASVKVDDAIIDYAVRLTAATRGHPGLQSGAGPRGSLALIRCARARALFEGRDFVLPDDVKILAIPALAHRIALSASSELDGISEQMIITMLLEKTEAPRI